jgi:hypothetical protein
MARVSTNRVNPTAKMVLYSSDPVGTSPAPVAAMNAVIVSTAWRGSNDRLGCCPAAMSTIIVSPTARETASTYDATIPEIAAGTTIRVDTCSFVEPSA